MSRTHWFDESSHTPQIEQHARQLSSFVDALADGKVEAGELKAQEARVTSLMKEVEPLLDDKLHAKVTQLLCELTAYDLMRMIHEMQTSRRKTVFHG